MEKEKVVLAFSGGLDTSFCAKYLTEECGYELYTAIANTGGFNADDLKLIEEKAYKLGAVKHASLDITGEYYDKSIKYMIFGNVRYLPHIGKLRKDISGYRNNKLCQGSRCTVCGTRKHRCR